MPELPEVERGRVIATTVARGRTIVGVHCPADPILLDGITPSTLRAALRGRRVKEVHRRGKHLWLELDRAPHPLFHFGMTGSFQAYPDGSPRPRYCRVELTFDHGWRLAMPDPRRFGRVRLRRDPMDEPPLSELGFDPLLEMPSPAAFRALLQKRRAPIKAVLLDQSFAAGIGNWIADEALYQAGIDPRRPAEGLSRQEAGRLRRTVRNVVETATAVLSDHDRFPRTWLFHARWGKKQGARSPRGEAIEHIVVGGRTTAWVPSRQR
ncbi:MAG: hypothetical protein KDA22_00355 [Phycisphaerales bacterium]|nr:hypothetical protein [Phycisphaerales bacterium]